jgi:hypothetical protein
MVTARAGAVIIQPNLATPLAVDLAGQHHLPSISLWRAFAHAGGLMSYGAHEEAAYRRIAVYVDRLLKGAKPADLPVEQPTKLLKDDTFERSHPKNSLINNGLDDENHQNRPLSGLEPLSSEMAILLIPLATCCRSVPRAKTVIHQDMARQ